MVDVEDEDGTSHGDVGQFSLRPQIVVDNVAEHKESVFDFTHFRLTRALALQLKDVISSVRGKSSIVLNFSSNAKKLHLQVDNVNVEKFKMKYNIFFSKMCQK